MATLILNPKLRTAWMGQAAGHQLKMKGAEYPSMELFGYVLLDVYDISSSVSQLYTVVVVENYN